MPWEMISTAFLTGKNPDLSSLKGKKKCLSYSLLIRPGVATRFPVNTVMVILGGRGRAALNKRCIWVERINSPSVVGPAAWKMGKN